MKYWKRTAAALLSLGFAASVLSACGADESGTTVNTGVNAANYEENSEGDASGSGTTGEVVVNFSEDTTVVGISLSGSEDADAEALRTELEGAGCGVVVTYANEDGNLQVTQLNQLVAAGMDVLVLDAVDAASAQQWLASQLPTDASANGGAASSGTAGETLPFEVITIDTCVASDLVTAFVGVDYEAMGAAEAEYILTALGLNSETPPEEVLTIEFAAGQTEEDRRIFEGAMETLSPYLEAGSLVIPSGNNTYELVSAVAPAATISGILTATYSANGLEIDALLTTSGTAAVDALTQLETLYTGSVFPIVTGAQCDLASAEQLRLGFLSMTVVTPDRSEDWVSQVAALVKSAAEGSASDVLTAGTTVTADTFEEVLIQSGTYAYDETDQLVEGSGVPVSDGETDGGDAGEDGTNDGAAEGTETGENVG